MALSKNVLDDPTTFLGLRASFSCGVVQNFTRLINKHIGGRATNHPTHKKYLRGMYTISTLQDTNFDVCVVFAISHNQAKVTK